MTCRATERHGTRSRGAIRPVATGRIAEEMTGPAGTAFITRGVDYHKVVTPLVRKRQIYAARFCINEFNYPGPDRDGDPVPSEVVAERVGSDEQLRYVTGLRFDWSN